MPAGPRFLSEKARVTMGNNLAIEMIGITKAFGTKVVANKNVNMDLREGEILALLGENGSGKTTLMNMIAGIYTPDSGRILVRGEEVVIKSPIDAFDHHIGFEKLVDKRFDIAVIDDVVDIGHQFVMGHIVEELLKIDVDDIVVSVIEIFQDFDDGLFA